MKRDAKARSEDGSPETLDAAGRRFGIVAARWNRGVVDRLLEAARLYLLERGAAEDDLLVVRVPGAWEIPLALEELAASGRCDALVALGAVIRGETPHFEYVCSEASRGCLDVSLRHRLPVGFGILTTDDQRQAEERAGGSAGNKGIEAAEAALEMLHLQERLGGRSVSRAEATAS